MSATTPPPRHDRDTQLVNLLALSKCSNVSYVKLYWCVVTRRIHPARLFPLQVTYREWLRLLEVRAHRKGLD